MAWLKKIWNSLFEPLPPLKFPEDAEKIAENANNPLLPPIEGRCEEWIFDTFDPDYSPYGPAHHHKTPEGGIRAYKGQRCPSGEFYE